MSMPELAEEHLQLCTFCVKGGSYAVDVLDVREVNTETSITPVSHAPRGVRGLVNVRGQVFLIFDVGLLLGFGETSIQPSSRLILFKEVVGPTFGILVDKVGDILHFPVSKIVTHRRKEPGSNWEKETSLGERPDGLVRGVCKFDEQLVVLFEPRRLIEVQS